VSRGMVAQAVCIRVRRRLVQAPWQDDGQLSGSAIGLVGCPFACCQPLHLKSLFVVSQLWGECFIRSTSTAEGKCKQGPSRRPHTTRPEEAADSPTARQPDSYLRRRPQILSGLPCEKMQDIKALEAPGDGRTRSSRVPGHPPQMAQRPERPARWAVSPHLCPDRQSGKH
jgi:hypothetical protein